MGASFSTASSIYFDTYKHINEYTWFVIDND